MAALITGIRTNTTRGGEETRLGSQWALARAATWGTEASVELNRDGSGAFILRELPSGREVQRVTFGPEAERTGKEG